MTLEKLKESNNGTLPAYAWPGGYPVIYITDDADVMCPKCANEEENVHFTGDADGWRIDAYDVFYEGAAVNCCNCNERIESAYGWFGNQNELPSDPEPENV